jgi:hypothetical protein
MEEYVFCVPITDTCSAVCSVVRSKAEAWSAAQPKIVPLPDDDEDGEVIGLFGRHSALMTSFHFRPELPYKQPPDFMT